MSILFTFCTNSKKKLYDDFSKIHGKEIILPDSLKVFEKGIFKENFKDFFNRSKPSFIVKIDGDCFSCLEQLYDWSEFVKENSCIQYIFIICADNYINFKLYSELANFTYPVIYDRSNTYSNINRINSRTEVILLDSNQRVIVYGSPFINKKMHVGYKKHILKLCNERITYTQKE